ncbi:hypothetical protein [Tenacibaculum jejuense]|uniref:Uncharacterized protein n=1 Tax=Tenacibaculum jejuense TaxID=584609 RepID=A0A238U8H7_9FLAO|nr:hypothetical protein [Tenacibaculum jejuense]SNR14710.1 conserved protein of unknown function [Tenacibaculum jejuense]
MSFEWPNHPLFDQLCEKATLLLPKLDFKKIKSDDGQVVYISKEKVLITIQHGGYDMPCIYIGNKEKTKLFSPNGMMEYYFDKSTPIYSKYLKLNSFHNFEFEYDFLEKYYGEILNILNSPKPYLIWKEEIDNEKISQLIKKNKN